VFLTNTGGLELCWEDVVGSARQIEFKSDGLDYYLAATDDEGSLGLDGIPELVSKFATA